MLTRSAARANHVDVEQFPSTPKRSNKSTSETPLIRDYVRSMNELKDEIREFREDVLIKSWVNSSRLDMLEGIVEKLANVMDKFVSLVDGPPHNVGNVCKISIIVVIVFYRFN